MNKADLLVRIAESHQKLDAALARIDQQDMEFSPSPEQWTVKETLVHITAWEQTLLADYRKLVKGEPIHEFDGAEEIDEHNAAICSRAQGMPLQQAKTEFQITYAQIVAWLENLSEDELERPFAYGMTLGDFIGEDTWKHYEEHLENFTSKMD